MAIRNSRVSIHASRRTGPRQLVLVADSGTARLLQLAGARGAEKLVEIAVLEQPSARLPSRALVTDRTGRVFDSGARTGHGPKTHARHGAQSDYDPHVEETVRFARRVSRRLDVERRRNRFGGLVVISARRFLGVLRTQLSAPTRQWITREVAKDLVRAADAQVVREARS
jgi:protein required for attachment to host cells